MRSPERMIGEEREVGGNLEDFLSLKSSCLTVAPPTFPAFESELLTGFKAEFRTMGLGLAPLSIPYTLFPGSTT